MCKSSKGRDLINQIKDACYQILESTEPEYIPVIMVPIKEIRTLMENSRLQERSIFSTISQKERIVDTQAPQS